MNKFCKKPVVIKAIQWDGKHSTLCKIKDHAGDRSLRFGLNATMHIETLEGFMTAQKGDWIIKGVHGELYLCKPDIFSKTYESV